MQPGQVVGDRYRIEQMVGEGGIGRVFQARDLQTRGLVAIKSLRPEFAKDTRIRRRFMREARAVARLQHAHIVRLFECGEADDTPFIAMELIEGAAMSEHREQGLHLDTLLHVVDQTLAALAFAHARGVVHRDVKPENILVTFVDRGRRPHIKLVDFGFARVEGDTDNKLTQVQGDAFGTPLYMAPEQASAKGNIGPETDLYAIGVILFEFLSGHPPFTGAHGMAVALKHVMEPVPALTARAGLTLPLGLEEVVRRALEKDPRNRWRSAADMRRALVQFMSPGTADAAAEEVDDVTMAGQGTLTVEGAPALPPVVALGPAASPFRDAPVSDSTVVSPFARILTGGGLPLPALQPLEAEPSRAGALGVAAPGAAALVGREEDMLWLWETVREVCERGLPRLLLLSAAPGMGKRLLVGWLEDEITEGAWMHRLQVRPMVRQPAARTDLRGLVAQVFGQLPAERKAVEAQILSALERWASLPSPLPRPERAMLGVLAATFSVWLAPVAQAGAALSGYGHAGMAGDEGSELRGEALYARTLELFQIAARERPVLFTVEDADALGPETTAFIAWLARWLAHVELPLLVVVGYTAETGEPPRQPAVAALIQAIASVGGAEVKTRALGPLGPDAIRTLLAGIAPLEPTVAEAIIRRTRGNPYFAWELAAWAIQSGELTDERGQLVLSRTARPPQWPATLAETLLLRTDETLRRKPEAGLARLVLESSSLLGESFDYDLLLQFMMRLTGNRSGVERAIEVLLQVDIVGESGSLEGDRLHLTHGVLRAALLERASREPDLPRRHRAAAEALAHHYRDEPGPVAEEVGRHFQAAGDADEAARYLVAAAAFRRKLGHLTAAVDLLEAADALLASLPAGPDDQVELRRASGWLDLGELELKRGQAARARTLAGRVYTWARQNQQTALEGRALLLVSDQLRRQNMLPEAAKGYGQARKVFERAQEPGGYARALLGAAMVERSQGRVESAVELFELARQAMEEAGDHHGLARAWRGQGEIALRVGEVAAARDRLELARQAYATAGDHSGVTFCHWLLGETYRLLGQPDLAVSHFEAARRGHAALRDDAGRARAHLSLARLLRDRGLWHDAEAHFEAAAFAYAAAGDVARSAGARTEFGQGALMQRRFDVAQANLEAGLQYAVQAGEEERAAVLRASLAWCHAEQGDEAAAEPELQSALAADARRPLLDSQYARALEGVAEVDTYLGRRTRALRLLLRAAEVQGALGQVAEVDRLQRKAALMNPRSPR